MNDNDAVNRALADRLSILPASTIADATGGKGVVASGLMRFSGTGTAVGRAVTAACAEGSLQAVFVTLDQADPGTFLCITAPGPTAYLGDLLAADIQGRGLVGAVVDGLIRDRATIAPMPTSFFARGTSPFARRAQGEGRSMVPIEIGGVTINPGDWIVADDDGVVVVPPADIEEVLAKAEENTRLEERIMARIAAGEKVRDAVKAELAAAAK